MTNATRQAKFKARQRSLGLRQISVWVSAEQAATIKAYLAGALRSPEKATAATVSAGASPARASVTGNAAASTATVGEAVVRTRRRARKPSPEALLIREHYNEIIERIRGGEKPSAIAVWLRQFGYQGTAAALNTTFGEDVRRARRASEQTRPRG